MKPIFKRQKSLWYNRHNMSEFISKHGETGNDQAGNYSNTLQAKSFEEHLRDLEASKAEQSAQDGVFAEKQEREQPRFEAVPFAEIAKELEDPRYEELGHGTISAENTQGILSDGLHVGGPGRDTDIDSNFMPLANNNSDALLNSAKNWQHNNAKYVVLYRIPFEYKMPTANIHSSETYSMFFEPNEADTDANSGKYNKDFAYAYLDIDSGLAYKNNAYKGDLDNPQQKMAMENKYQLLRDEIANKITDPDEKEGFLEIANIWHEMGENMMPPRHNSES